MPLALDKLPCWMRARAAATLAAASRFRPSDQAAKGLRPPLSRYSRTSTITNGNTYDTIANELPNRSLLRLLLSKLWRCVSAERPTPLTARSRGEAAVKGDRRESRQRACPLTAARTERLSIVQSLITQILASRNLEQRLVLRKKEVVAAPGCFYIIISYLILHFK